MINLYQKGNTDYTGNGDAVLMPLEGKLKQVAGGAYDISLTQPFDPEGSWKLLIPGAVLRVPVPEETIENAFAGVEADIYKVLDESELRTDKSEPTRITYQYWQPNHEYQVGAYVTQQLDLANYKCLYCDITSYLITVPPYACSWWQRAADYTTGAPSVAHLPAGTQLYFVEDAGDGWYKMSTYDGTVGYIKTTHLEFVKHQSASESKSREITDQLFRVTSAAVDTKNRRVQVSATHVSYDLNGNIVQNVKIEQATAAMAISMVTGGLMMSYPGTILTNLPASGATYTGEFKGKNGIYCLLDPDNGIAAHFKAMVKRDNWDIFILQKTNTDRGYRLQYRKNVLGINWSRKSDSLITRVVPVAKDEGGNDLYLPEKWVDSSLINDYPVIRMERLAVNGQVGKEKGEGQGNWTLEDLLTEMRAKAGERFSVDKVDQVVEEITIDMAHLAGTDEYRYLTDLERVLLYDKVLCEDARIGLSKSLTVTELEWDIVRRKVLAVKLSTENTSAGERTTAYSLGNNSIGEEKLSTTVREVIIREATERMPEFANPGGYTLPLAADGTRGGVQIGYTQSGKNYPIKLSSEKMYAELKEASDDDFGVIKLGFPQSGHNYPVDINGFGRAFVNVPWVNTEYGFATNAAAGLVQLGFTASGDDRPLKLDANGLAYVTAPDSYANNTFVYQNVFASNLHLDGALTYTVTKAECTANHFLVFVGSTNGDLVRHMRGSVVAETSNGSFTFTVTFADFYVVSGGDTLTLVFSKR